MIFHTLKSTWLGFERVMDVDQRTLKATKKPRKSSSKLSKPVRARKIGSTGNWLSFPSISEAGRFFNLRPGHVSSAIRKNQRHAGYYEFRYDEPLEPEHLQGEVWKPFLTAHVSNLGRIKSKTGVISTPQIFFHLQHQKFKIDRVIASLFGHGQLRQTTSRMNANALPFLAVESRDAGSTAVSPASLSSFMQQQHKS
jgi:hypothetical protein